MLIKFAGHDKDLGLGEPINVKSLNEFVHPARADPRKVAASHHAYNTMPDSTLTISLMIQG